MCKKLIFLDLDGTALNDAKQLTPGNRAAIDAALADGHKIVVTTGRPLASARIQAERHGLAGSGSYLIAYNGGEIYDIAHEQVLFRRTIALQTVREVFAEAACRGVHIQTYRGGHVLVDPQNDDAEVRYYCRLIEMTYEVIPDIAMLAEEPVKLHASMLAEQEKLAPFRDWILQTYPGVLDSFLSSPMFLEIVAYGMSKGAALRQMTELLSWPAADTIAIGDEANDVPMIRAAGLGAAMVNGIAEAKAAADYVTAADNNCDGVAEVIRKFALCAD